MGDQWPTAQIAAQKAAISEMLRTCCVKVKPHVKRQIYWTLQKRYMTFCRNVERVFGNIFADVEKLAKGREAATAPPTDVHEASPSKFFGDGFTWNWEWPVSVRVDVACKYYMWKRSSGEYKDDESAEAADRRILLIQMFLHFEHSGDLEKVSNKDGSDYLYKVPGSNTSVLVEAPDEGAVHVFARPSQTVSDSEHQARIFALFRHFSSLICSQITMEDG